MAPPGLLATLRDVLPDAPPEALLDAFLRAHAGGGAVPAVLLAQGEALRGRLAADPPADPRWGRFLVALGQLTAEAGDAAGASRLFQEALTTVHRHGDVEAAVTAGYDQGVLLERRGGPAALARALAAYRASAAEGFRCGALVPNTLRSAAAAVRLAFADTGRLLDGDAELLKRAWLCWLHLRGTDPAAVDADLDRELGRQLAAFLLPEDDPSALAARWRDWPPHGDPPDGPWHDGDPRCLLALYDAAADAAEAHLADEGTEPGAPYRALAAALRRSAPPAPSSPRR